MLFKYINFYNLIGIKFHQKCKYVANLSNLEMNKNKNYNKSNLKNKKIN